MCECESVGSDADDIDIKNQCVLIKLVARVSVTQLGWDDKSALAAFPGCVHALSVNGNTGKPLYESSDHAAYTEGRG